MIFSPQTIKKFKKNKSWIAIQPSLAETDLKISL